MKKMLEEESKDLAKAVEEGDVETKDAAEKTDNVDNFLNDSQNTKSDLGNIKAQEHSVEKSNLSNAITDRYLSLNDDLNELAAILNKSKKEDFELDINLKFKLPSNKFIDSIMENMDYSEDDVKKVLGRIIAIDASYIAVEVINKFLKTNKTN